LIELLGVGEEDSTERNQDSEAIEAWSHSEPDRGL
jgi:hypothetical protein